jgi:hypothetical protein
MNRISLSRRTRRMLVAFAAATALVVTGAVAYGAGDRANHARDTTTAKAALKIVGQSTGGGCRMGYDTQSSTLIPPDDSTSDNVAAATVNIRKVCPGAVTGMFVSEVSTPNAADFIHIDMRATCTGTGGLASPCTVGQQIFASPGHTFMRNGTDTVQTNSVQMVWTGLPRGLWRFDVLPGGNNSANLQFRSFVVEAFNAG